MTIVECLRQIADTLQKNGFVEAQKEARFLIQEALGLTAADMVIQSDRPLSAAEQARALMWGDRRAEGEPLAYISGQKGFYKNEFAVRPGVLIPRPETEFVVTTALTRIANPQWIADFGCGSGCIGLSLLGEWPAAKLWAVDASPTAIEVTRQNAERLGVSERTQTVHMRVEDWSPDQPLDLVVANPPYIADGDPKVEPAVHKFEPHMALYSGDQGLASLRGWLSHAYRHLREGGVVVCEIGAGQKGDVQAIMKACGFQAIEVTPDLAGIDRVLSACK